MKFAHLLKFNAVPEWQDFYLNYPALKKVIYALQQQQLENPAPNDGSVNVHRTTISELVAQARRALTSAKQKEDDFNKAAEAAEDEKFGALRIISKFRGRLKSGAGDHEVNKSSEEETYSVELYDSSLMESLNIDAITSQIGDGSETLLVFTKNLLTELSKIDHFFRSKDAELSTQYDNLVKDLEANKMINIHHQSHTVSTLERTVTNASVFDTVNHLDIDMEKGAAEEEEDDEDEDEDDDDDDQHSGPHSALLTHADFDVHQQKKITLKRRSVHLFIAMSELKSYIELNKIGFTKICKKFDKTCGYAVKDDFITNFLPENSHIFLSETLRRLDRHIEHIVDVYAFLSGKSHSTDVVREELKSHLRDHIVWERNTVWKDLLSLEKKQYNLHLDDEAVRHNKMGDEAHMKLLMHMQWSKLKLPFGLSFRGRTTVKVPSFLFTWQVFKIIVISIVFIILMTVKTMNDKQEARCLAVLAVSAMCWASEAIPLWVTSLMVPLLVVACKVLKNTAGDGPMDAADASSYILKQMWSSTLMILMGGFTLAGALSKYNIAKVVSSWMLAFAGTKPRNVLLAIMAVALFLSMWISNVAAPVLAYSLIQPVLRTLPTKAPFAQALVLGIALASNLGGMASPIASPQNVIAIQYMNPNPGWGKWFAVALPVAIVSLLGIWIELILTFKISLSKVKAYKPIREKFTTKQWYISFVCLLTILLWCVESQIEETFGSAGIIAVFPIVLLFGTGILKVDDVNNFPWSIVLLAMGGLALGSAVTSSGLLSTVAETLQKKVKDFDIFVVLLIFGVLILVVATFVSHTVATVIIVPLVKEIGESLDHPHPVILIMGTALLASAAMGLPTSGFPNVTAISMTDEVGHRYLTVNTFITRGVPASVIAYVVVVTLGYGIMNALSF